VPNEFGGRENLEAVSFLRRSNETVYAREPGVTTAAEESTGVPASHGRRTSRARLRLQVEHGLDARHADVLPKGPVYRRFTTTR